LQRRKLKAVAKSGEKNPGGISDIKREDLRHFITKRKRLNDR